MRHQRPGDHVIVDRTPEVAAFADLTPATRWVLGDADAERGAFVADGRLIVRADGDSDVGPAPGGTRTQATLAALAAAAAWGVPPASLREPCQRSSRRATAPCRSAPAAQRLSSTTAWPQPPPRPRPRCPPTGTSRSSSSQAERSRQPASRYMPQRKRRRSSTTRSPVRLRSRGSWSPSAKQGSESPAAWPRTEAASSR